MNRPRRRRYLRGGDLEEEKERRSRERERERAKERGICGYNTVLARGERSSRSVSGNDFHVADECTSGVSARPAREPVDLQVSSDFYTGG